MGLPLPKVLMFEHVRSKFCGSVRLVPNVVYITHKLFLYTLPSYSVKNTKYSEVRNQLLITDTDASAHFFASNKNIWAIEESSSFANLEFEIFIRSNSAGWVTYPFNE